MNVSQEFKLSGIALPKDASGLLDEICEHFVEHAEVSRNGNLVFMKSDKARVDIRLETPHLLIELTCSSEEDLEENRTMLAEHLFYFNGDDPMELTWSQAMPEGARPHVLELTVVSAENVTPHMRRVKFACADVTPFVNDDMHIRLLVPPRGRTPVWPGFQENGRIAWPEGEDALLVRVYTIRAVDEEKQELWIDFFQHPEPGVATPGVDFARDALPGDKAALLGPGGGHRPEAARMLLIGDETALPAIARIAAEVPEGTVIEAIIEVLDGMEEQPLPSAGNLRVEWLHRGAEAEQGKRLIAAAKAAISAVDPDTFVWIACEKRDLRLLRSLLKARQHDKAKTYAAWFWDRSAAQ